MKEEQTDPRPGEPTFSLHDFKRWLTGHSEGKMSFQLKRPVTNTCLEAELKVPIRNAMDYVEECGGNPESLLREFKREGGLIVEKDGNQYKIQVTSGTFILPRDCVRLV